MHICNCEHPVKIFNEYIKETMYVPCGKCDVCRNSRAKRWVDRLEQERACHPFTFFVYLDYDNEHLPIFDVAYNALEKDYYLYDTKHFVDVDGNLDSLFYDYVIPFHELKFDDKFDLDYFNERLEHPLHIPHGSVRDIQLFLKRLNKNFHDKVSNTYRNFRYFIVQEYGPTSHRPHYHGLVFVDNQKVADQFEQIFCETWKLGHADSKSVESSASSYVAQYLNCVTHLPSFYSHPKIRPFFLCSRQPPIGSLLESKEKVCKIFHDASPVRVLHVNKQKTSLSVVPLLSALKDRLFPKLPKFGQISRSFGVALYGIASVQNSKFIESFEEWKKFFLNDTFPEYFNLDGKLVRSLNYHFYTDITAYLSCISNHFEDDRPLREVFRISKRVLAQADVFNVSLDYYVRKIFEFYDNCEKYKISQFYKTQIELLDDGETIVDDLVFM